MQTLFVDLPNFYSSLLRSKVENPKLLMDYFLHWLDFDRLAGKLTGEFASVWIFYGKRFGPRTERVHEKILENYISRINSLQGVTAWDVDIRGTQREHSFYTCEKCSHHGRAEVASEKGVDASLIVRLFDTMDSWKVAYLLSGDADFVPAVEALRRRGKNVTGAGFPKATAPALIRECYNYLDLYELFIKEDFIAYQMFRDEGIIWQWLNSEIKASGGSFDPITLSFSWQFGYNNSSFSGHGRSCAVYLMANGPIDLSSRHELIEAFHSKYPDHVAEINLHRRSYILLTTSLAWEGIEQRLDGFFSSSGITLWGREAGGPGGEKTYTYNADENKYE